MSKKCGVGAHALDQSVGAERHLFDIARHRQRGEHDFGLLGDLLRRIGPDGTLHQKRLGRGAAQIVHDKVVPGLLQIGRHAFAHHAEADKSNAHPSLSLNRKPTAAQVFPRPAAGRKRQPHGGSCRLRCDLGNRVDLIDERPPIKSME